VRNQLLSDKLNPVEQGASIMLIITDFYQWFHNYYASFYSADPEIMAMVRFKEDHSIRVANCARDLAENISLTREEVNLAELCGLLHDIARGEQAQFKTFKDSLSFDHGDRGMVRIEASGILDKLDSSLKEIILFSIKYHNKLAVPSASPSKTQFANITRDADKLDILRTLHPIEADHTYSPALIELLRTGKNLSYTEVHTQADIRLIRFGWLYDINYSWTLTKLVEEGYTDKLLAALPNESPFDEIKAKFLTYLKNRLSTAT
jgi:putative nucleotidyltransferase with HDIG domain